jgi:hypothetical protein
LLPGRLTGLSHIITHAALLAGPLALHLVFPVACPMRLATGLDCPGCGGTRAVHAIVNLDIAAAADLNLVVLAGPALLTLLLIVAKAWPALRWSQADPFRFTVGVLMTWTVVRNLPWFDILRAAT